MASKMMRAAAVNTRPEFSVFNTMSRQKEVFKPKIDGKVSMYICGVTAYDYSHLGHARAYVSFDILYRFLKHLGYDVTYVRNFTDIDDKIINRAKESGEDPVQLSRRFCDEFHKDMAALNCLPPTVEPRVSEYVTQIVDMISKIIDNGYAYALEGGDVFFSLEDFMPKCEYGCLSGRKVDDNRAGERVKVDERKRNPGDFALWKSSKAGEPAWDSPWGPGRPGWHIECSAMSAATLGYSFDIHGGGMDLIFPHHENEIAQSRAACESSHVTYWMHNGFVTVDETKMSKSLKNFFTIRQVLEDYHPMALRYFLLTAHYRSAINYSQAHLDTATEQVYSLYQTLAEAEKTIEKDEQEGVEAGKASKAAIDCVSKFKSGFYSSLADDLHTPINNLADPLKLLNESVAKKKKDKSRYASSKLLKGAIEEVLEVLGLAVDSYEEALQGMNNRALKNAGLTEAEVQSKIEERLQARKLKEYKRSDDIRDDLLKVGIAALDFGEEVVWRPATVKEKNLMLERKKERLEMEKEKSIHENN